MNDGDEIETMAWAWVDVEGGGRRRVVRGSRWRAGGINRVLGLYCNSE